MTRKRPTRTRITSASPAPRRAVLYARYSSDMQRDSWSVEAQLADLRRHCSLHGWEIVAEYIDEAKSAKGGSPRPGFEQAMQDIRNGKGNVFLTHKVNRFGRNMRDIFTNVDELESLGAALVCTNDPIDTTNPVVGKIMLAVLAVLAETYLDNLSEETSKGKRARAQAGLYNGDLPYGYKNRDEGTERSGAGINNATVPVVVREEAIAVQHAFELYATGQYSDRRVAQKLKDEGHRMVSKRHPDGHPFTKDTITALLQNVFYTGAVTLYGDEVRDEGGNPVGLHQAIIDRSLFDRVQALRATRNRQGRKGSTQGQAYTYLASGLARCACCHEPLRAQGSATRRPAYRDAAEDRGIGCATSRKSISEEVVARDLGAAVQGLHLPADWREQAAIMEAQSPDETARIASERAALERKLAHLEELEFDPEANLPEVRKRKAIVKAELAALHSQQQTVGSAEPAAALLDNLGLLWEKATPEERRNLAASLFDGVYCDLDGKRIVGVKLKRAFLPLRNALPKHTATNPAEATSACTPDEAECTQCGTDGIRTRDLLRDRQACWATTPRLQGNGKRPYAPKE